MRPNWRNNLTTLLLAAGVLASTAAVGAMSMKEAISYALEHAPTLDNARQNALIATLTRDNAKAAFLPSLDVSAQNGLQKSYNPSAVSDPWASALNANLSESIYDNGQSLTQFKISKLQEEIANLSAQQTRDHLCLDVLSQFYTYSLNVKLKEVTEQQRGIVHKQFAFVNEQYRQGLKLRRDYLKFRSQEQRAEIALKNSLAAIAKSEYQLKLLIGVPTGPWGSESLTFNPLDSGSLNPVVPLDPPPVENTFEFRVAQKQTALNPLNVSLSERKYYPQLLLTAGATYTNNLYVNSGLPFNNTSQYGWNVLLTLNYNIWDWGLRRRNVEIARSQAMLQENSWRQSAITVEAAIQSLMVDMRQSKANFDLSRELMASEEETYNAIKRDYEEGKLTNLDLITSLNDLLDARTQFYTALYTLSSDTAQYQYYNGKLYDSLFQP